MHDYWKGHSLDSTNLCPRSNVSALQHTVKVCHSFPAKKQTSSDFMAAVSILSDLRAHEEEICHYFHFSPLYLPWSDGTGCHDLSFLILSFKSVFSLSSLNLIKRLFSFSSLSAIIVLSSAYVRLLIFLLAILIPAWAYPAWHFIWLICI